MTPQQKAGITKKSKLSPKEQAFVEEYIKTGNGTQSALKVYDTDDDNVAANVASQNLRKPKIVDYITEKLNDKMLAEKHLMLLNKEEVIVRNNVSTKKIEVIPTGQMDVQAVKAGLDMAYKIKGKYKTDEKPSQTNNTYNFILNQEFQSRIKPLEEELKRQFKNAQPTKNTPQDVEVIEKR